MTAHLSPIDLSTFVAEHLHRAEPDVLHSTPSMLVQALMSAEAAVHRRDRRAPSTHMSEPGGGRLRIPHEERRHTTPTEGRDSESNALDSALPDELGGALCGLRAAGRSAPVLLLAGRLRSPRAAPDQPQRRRLVTSLNSAVTSLWLPQLGSSLDEHVGYCRRLIGCGISGADVDEDPRRPDGAALGRQCRASPKRG